MQTLNDYLNTVTVGDSVTHRNLAMFPLFGGPGGEAGYLTLDEALETGQARITEVGEGGSVPELRFENQCDQPVLLLDGEELIGAKQNRILNLTVLAPAKSTITIPVSCVEAGRWSWRSRDFRAAGRAHYASGRASKMEDVSYSMCADGTRYSRQDRVWDDIAMKCSRLDANSDTGAADEMYAIHRASLDEFLEAIHPVTSQTGALFAINGQVIGFDLFDVPVTLTRQLAKLVHSYALDAIDEGEREAPEPSPQECQRLLDDLAAANVESYPAVGAGQDLRIIGQTVRGGALFDGERLIHLCGFRVGREVTRLEDFDRTRIARASRRRGH